MTTTRLRTPTSLARVGIALADMTPPIGIYHRLWGAARHDRATGVHRPLVAAVLLFAPVTGQEPAVARVYLDLAGLARGQHDALARMVAEAAGLPAERVTLGYSHTHSGGWHMPDRVNLPGGELIEPYLDRLAATLYDTTTRAAASMVEATITYATGRCALAANRDYWDAERERFVCGFNPDASADQTLVVARVTSAEGRLIATLVNYACHPTTLAWENSLISPDYVGAMRETVEQATGAPCVFALGACGDLGPRHGFVGDTKVADQNGRELGYAALATLTAMGPPATTFTYAGPVTSGATLGVWSYQPLTADEWEQTGWFAYARSTADLPRLPAEDPARLREEMAAWEARQRQADAAGDAVAARDAGAQAERARRWLARLQDVPPGATFPLRYSALVMGNAVWVTCGGEPYNLLQTALRRRFPDLVIIVSPLDGDLQVAYLLPRDRYGQGLYQEEPSSLAPGCLEQLIEAIGDTISAMAWSSGPA